MIDSLDLSDCTISIDAIGCQVQIAEKIIDTQANYLLVVKKNQGQLYQAINDPWIWQQTQQEHEQWEYDHGRYEIRTCQILDAKTNLPPSMITQWTGIKTIIKITSQRMLRI